MKTADLEAEMHRALANLGPDLFAELVAEELAANPDGLEIRPPRPGRITSRTETVPSGPVLTRCGGREFSCELVSENAKFPASRENTGNFIDSGLGGASEAAKKGMKSVSYGPIPYAS